MNENEEKTYRELIITKLDNLNEKIGGVNEKADKTLAQTIKTNGRVTKLESWRSYMIGAGVVLVTILLSVLIPVMDALIRAGKLF